MSVLVVGAGCTGAATALRLRQLLGSKAKIEVWEKARGAGGRYTTSRDKHPDGMRADMGAQYASVDPSDTESVALMEAIVQANEAELVEEGLAETAERPAGTLQYRGLSGQNGIVKAMLSMSGAEVSFERRVKRIDAKEGRWAVTPFEGPVREFTCIILAVPGCGSGGDNLNKIHGNWEQRMSNENWREAEVPHDCRYSFALWIKPGHGQSFADTFGKSCEMRLGGKSVELLVWQTRKDGEPLDGPQVVVAHSPQGASGSKRDADSRMTAEICKTLKIPQSAITSNKLITWFQSQVLSTTAKKPFIVANESPHLLLAGDYLTSSTFTGCSQSASACATEAARLLGAAGSKESGRPVPTTKQESGATTKEGQTPAGRRWKTAEGGGYSAAPAPAAAAAPAPAAEQCSYCGKKAKCFVDTKDKKRYCAPCWKAYYGKDPAVGG